MTKLLKNREGFTLIELLVVIAIIGVLAAVVLLAINPAQMLKKGRDSQRQNDLTNLRKAIDLYMVNNSSVTTPPGGASASRRSDLAVANICQATAAGRTNSATGGWMVPCGGAAPQPTCAACVAGSTGTADLTETVAKIPTDPSMSATPAAADSYRYLYETNGNSQFSLMAKYEAQTGCFQTGTYVTATACW